LNSQRQIANDVPIAETFCDIDEFGVAIVVLLPLVWFIVDNGVIALMLTAAGRESWRDGVRGRCSCDLLPAGAQQRRQLAP